MDEMIISEEGRQKFVEWIRSKWTTPKCPYCQKTEWEVGQYLARLAARSMELQGGTVIGGPEYPLLVVTCKNCANTVLINALAAGIIVAPEKEADDVDK